MNQFQLIVLVCAGVVTILGAVSIVAGTWIKKEIQEMKPACIERFREVEFGAKDRNDRMIVMETQFKEIISKIKRVEIQVEKNVEMTNKIYGQVSKRKIITNED